METIKADDFGKAKEVANAVVQVAKDSKINPEWIRLAEIADSILKNVLALKNSANQAPQQQQGLPPEVVNARMQQGTAPPIQAPAQQVEVNYRIVEAYKELVQLIREQKIIDIEKTTIKELIDDTGFIDLLSTDIAQAQIKSFIKKHSEVTLK